MVLYNKEQVEFRIRVKLLLKMSSVANYLVLSEMQLMTQLIAKREIRQQSLCLDSTFNNFRNNAFTDS